MRYFGLFLILLVSGALAADAPSPSPVAAIPATSPEWLDFKGFFDGHVDMFVELTRRFYSNGKYNLSLMPGATGYDAALPKRRFTGKASQLGSTAPVPTPLPDVTYTFSTEGWMGGKLKAVVVDSHTKYQISVTSELRAERWILHTDDEAKQQIAEGTLDRNTFFVIDRPGAFPHNLALVVAVVSDENTNSVLLPLHK